MMDACESCAISKANKKNQKGMNWIKQLSRERLYVNIILIDDESFVRAKFWAFIVDDCTDYCWSYFVKSEDQLKTKVVELVEELNKICRFDKYIRLDDAEGNASIERACKEKCLDIKFELGNPGKPQRNKKSERSFQK
jgi:hypothetical protein